VRTAPQTRRTDTTHGQATTTAQQTHPIEDRDLGAQSFHGAAVQHVEVARRARDHRARAHACPTHRAQLIEAPWLANSGHGASLRQPFEQRTRETQTQSTARSSSSAAASAAGAHARARPDDRTGAGGDNGIAKTCRTVGKSQSVLMIINSMISTRTRTHRDGGRYPAP
jgi:hypothetical protein